MAKDYYQLLGVSKDADEKTIKQAYRGLAKKYHPDANPDDPGAEARFKEIGEAYETLSDPEKRAQYDQFGADYARYQNMQGQYGNAGGFGGFGNTGGFRVDVDDAGNNPFSDVFESIFGGFGGRGAAGGGRARQTSMPGRDLEHEISINLREAYEGTTRYITKGDRRLKVNIPAGAATGTKVRLSGEGEQGMGGPGDLYLIVNVEPDNQFEREGDDLSVDVEIDLFTATLGGGVRVPTMARPVKVNVPPGTQSGQRLRVRGKGMPRLRTKDEYGNLYARVMVTVPQNLTPTQRELLMQFKESLD
jgi:curved DNA-binding protein